METVVILLRRNERGRVSLMHSSRMWGLTKGRPWTWDISADLRIASKGKLPGGFVTLHSQALQSK